MVEAYLREAVNMPAEEKPTPEEIELYITRLLFDKDQVEYLFSIEIIPVDNSYILKPKNDYTSIILGEMPMFCRECGKLLESVHFRGREENTSGYMPCFHEHD